MGENYTHIVYNIVSTIRICVKLYTYNKLYGLRLYVFIPIMYKHVAAYVYFYKLHIHIQI